MKSHVQVAVIGGGVVGASVLYHLAKAGWTDVVLIERDELTSGSTWHAAGGMHTLNGDPNVAKLQKYTIELYKEIEEASGQSCSIHITAGVDLAGTPERMDFLKLACARARYLGLGMEIISDRRGRAHLSADGQAAFRRGAVQPARRPRRSRQASPMRTRRRRAISAPRSIASRASPVSSSAPTARGTCAPTRAISSPSTSSMPAGLWAREVGRFAGLELPILAMEHQYIVTGEIPEVVASQKEVLHAIDFEGEIYMRQEGKGMLIGTYEKGGVPWAERRDAVEFHARASAARSRSHRRQPRGRLPPFPPAGARRHQADRQRAVHLCAGRQSGHRSDPRAPQLLGRVRRDGGVQPGRRRRARAVELDDPWRSGLRRLGDGRGALRRLGDDGVHQREGARELFAALSHPLSQRRTCRRRVRCG